MNKLGLSNQSVALIGFAVGAYAFNKASEGSIYLTILGGIIGGVAFRLLASSCSANIETRNGRAATVQWNTDPRSVQQSAKDNLSRAIDGSAQLGIDSSQATAQALTRRGAGFAGDASKGVVLSYAPIAAPCANPVIDKSTDALASSTQRVVNPLIATSVTSAASGAKQLANRAVDYLSSSS